MPYLIDANNLAGKLDLLDEDDFDQKLIKIIKEYISAYNKNITLVFEGRDPMGDKVVDGNLTIIRAPRDGDYYKDADVKIIEMINSAEKLEQLVVITDDREIIEAAEQAGCQIKKASYFVQILKYNANVTN